VIHPFLHHGNIVWATEQLFNLLKRQKKGLRVTFSSCKAPSRPLLQKLILLDIKKNLTIFLLALSVSIFHSQCISKITVHAENTRVHKYYTSKSNNLHKKFNRTIVGVFTRQETK